MRKVKAEGGEPAQFVPQLHPTNSYAPHSFLQLCLGVFPYEEEGGGVETTVATSWVAIRFNELIDVKVLKSSKNR